MKTFKVSEPRAFMAHKRMRISGHIVDVKEYEKLNGKMPIEHFDSDHYVVVSSGEILPYKKTENRSESLASIRLSMDNLRAILNANFMGDLSEAWVTLTYRENMTNPKQLYLDRKLFWKKLCYKYKNIDLEYVSIAEPQKRGAWHLHECWKRMDGERLFIDQKEIMQLWGHGGVNIKRLDNSDNIGAYLTAYLSNLPEFDGNGNIKNKHKGARLNLYPSHMNFYRCSRGIHLPKWHGINELQLKAILGDDAPKYRQVIEIYDENNERVQTVLHKQYNIKPGK